MGFEIQVHTQTLVAMIENLMQEGFRTRCLPSADPYYVDHVDVVTGKTDVSSAIDGINFAVTLNVFVVESSAVLAAPNGVPAGATSPIGQATITLRLSLAGTVATMACTKVDLGVIAVALGSAAATVENQIQQTIGTVGSLDVGSITTSIGIPPPSTSNLEIVGASVLIRFDTSGSGQERLQLGQDWCLFAEANTMIQLVEAKLDKAIKNLGSVITSHTTTAAWTPSGTTPEMSVSVAGKAQVPDPFSGDVFVGMQVVFGLIHVFIVNDGISADLTLDVTWNPSVELGWFFDFLVPPWVTQLVITALSSQLDPKQFGAIPLGPHEFELLAPLPAVSFGGASLHYGSVVGLPDGMVLGGPVSLPPDPGTTTLSLNEISFPDSFSMFVDCSKGSSNAKPTLATVTASASASFVDAGAICDIHFVSPTSPPISLSTYLTAPANGTVEESGTISETLPGTAALALSQDPQAVQLWVQTARGIRLLDFGTPPTPQLDNQGDVTNFHVVVINDCPSAVDPWARVFHMYNPKWSVDPPQSWTRAMEQIERFETLLIEVGGLRAGSLVRFDMPILGLGVGSVFSANAAGRVVVPAVLAARSDNEGARLSTADRQKLGEVAVTTAVFERIAVLDTPGALSHQLAEEGGAALVTSTFAGGRVQAARVDAMRVPRVLELGPGDADSIRSRKGPPTGPGEDRGPDVPGLTRLHPVPGFESDGFQVAELDDGTHLALADDSGRLRVTGIVPAWPHMPMAGDAWAISASEGDRVAVFAISRTVQREV